MSRVIAEGNSVSDCGPTVPIDVNCRHAEADTQRIWEKPAAGYGAFKVLAIIEGYVEGRPAERNAVEASREGIPQTLPSRPSQNPQMLNGLESYWQKYRKNPCGITRRVRFVLKHHGSRFKQ